jgi:hypothetical protein
MSIGIGIGIGISGAQQNVQLVTGWFAISASCGFSLSKGYYTEFLDSVPYKTGDFIETSISGRYAGKRILLGPLVTQDPSPAGLIEIEAGSPAYNACQI